jgi:hypothetical protein
MFKKELVWAAIVACLSTLDHRGLAIEPLDGTNIVLGPAGDVIALHYLTAANVGILGAGLSLVPDTTNVTIVGLFQGGTGGVWSSGTFTNGLAGGYAEVVGHGELPPVEGVQTVGGIGIDKGVCLSTGRMQNRNPSQAGGYGVNGPNEAQPEDLGFGPLGHPATASKYLYIDEVLPDGDDYGDADLAEAADPDGQNIQYDKTNDRCALEFQVTTTVTGYIQVQVVFATDEYPEWIDDDGVFDDTFGVFIWTDAEGLDPVEDNIAAFHGDADPLTPGRPFSLFACQSNPELYFVNQSVPTNENFLGESYYNHEYDFFTKKFLIESRKAYPPGTYNVKIVIHDAGEFAPGAPDDYVDSALFIEGDSFKLNTAPLIAGDYNANGSVEQADLDLVLLNWGAPADPAPAGWIHDLPTGNIDQDELDGVLLNWGNQEFRADFDRDGDVDQADEDIWQEFNGLDGCALRTLGDANDDSLVNAADYTIWQNESGGMAGTFELLLEAASLCQFGPVPGPFPAPLPPVPQPQPEYPPQPEVPLPAPIPQPSPAPAPQSAPSAPAPSLTPAPSATPSTVPETGTTTDAAPASEPASQPVPTTSPQPSAAPSTRASGHDRYDAIAEILAIAHAYWTEGRTDWAKLIWEGVGRVYGEFVLDDSVLELLD